MMANIMEKPPPSLPSLSGQPNGSQYGCRWAAHFSPLLTALGSQQRLLWLGSPMAASRGCPLHPCWLCWAANRGCAGHPRSQRAYRARQPMVAAMCHQGFPGTANRAGLPAGSPAAIGSAHCSPCKEKVYMKMKTGKWYGYIWYLKWKKAKFY